MDFIQRVCPVRRAGGIPGFADRTAGPTRAFALVGVLVAAVMLPAVAAATAEEASERPDRPHIVWLMSEDNSKHYLRLFDPSGAPTPAIESLAEEGVVFERAFSNAPVCSVARTTLITGSHAPRLFTSFHRRLSPVALPEGLAMFPALLREAGYHTTNRRKEDYNTHTTPGTWDESSGEAHWRDRAEGQPFFHCRTFTSTHEGRLHVGPGRLTDQRLNTDPATVRVPGYAPDTDLMRRTTALYHDLITAMDGEIAALVRELQEDGVWDNTIVFYFGDHGGVLPGSKGHWRDGGVHVPLVVRVPERWQHLVPGGETGVRTEAFVSFIDFGPTALALAGTEVPDAMDGTPFLGEGVDWEDLDRTFSYQDRFDEKYDMVRSLRVGDWKYVRFYQPQQADGLRNNYRDNMLAYQEWRQLAAAGELDGPPAAFFQPRPVEALFNLADDPDEVDNLAADPAHRERLLELRAALSEARRDWPDLAFLPESVLDRHATGDPAAFGDERRGQLRRLMDVADLALLPPAEAVPALTVILGDPGRGRWQRWWALNVAAGLDDEAAREELLPYLRAHLGDDRHPLLRGRAVEALAVWGGDHDELLPVLLDALAATDHAADSLVLLQTLVLLRDQLGFEVDPAQVRPGAGAGEVERRLAYLAGE